MDVGDDEEVAERLQSPHDPPVATGEQCGQQRTAGQEPESPVEEA
jgi:hypothetical protein